MKKHLLALAALATVSGVAAAQSATVYGIIDLSVASSTKVTQYAANGSTITATGTNKGLADAVWMPSVFGITGSEDLGGGLKASFNLESDVNTDTGALSAASGSKLFGRKSNVNLSGNFGTITAGKDIDMIFLQGFIDNIRNSHSASGFMAHALKDYVTAGSLQYVNEKNVFSQNLVRYTTPTFNGFKLSYQHTFGEIAGANSVNKTDAFLANYSNGPFTLAAGWKKTDNLLQTEIAGTTATEAIAASDNIDSKLTYVGATYTLGALKFAATYHQSKWTEAGALSQKTKTSEVGVAYTINPKLVAAVNYVSQKDLNEKSGDIQSASLKYSLSKRTSLWSLVSKSSTTGTAVLGGNYALGGTNSYAVGVTHSF
jgi:predicted porin